MNWLVWKLYRKQFLMVGVAVVAYTAMLITMGHLAQHAYHHPKTSDYSDPWMIGANIAQLSIAIPALLGMFWGAPLIAKEYIENTNKLAWTQGTSRNRWFAAKIGWMLAFAGVCAALISIANIIASRVDNGIGFNRFSVTHFDTQGLMPIIYTLFAISLGIFLGAWLRRLLPAMAIALAVFVVITFSVGIFARPHYLPPKTADYSFSKDVSEGSTSIYNQGIWALHEDYTEVSHSCNSGPGGGKVCGSVQTLSKIVYQPADRYWLFQGIEAGIYLVLSAGLIAATARMIRKRDA